MRYFLEVSYNGSKYAGFQIQQNAPTIQSELEKALFTLFRTPFHLTGSSRTDAGVHAFQNFFHVDTHIFIEDAHVYNINSILPSDIVLKSVRSVSPQAHSRFDAIGREYKYFIYDTKNAFLKDTAWFYPYPLNVDVLTEVALRIKETTNFVSFSKRNIQLNNFNCSINESYWVWEEDRLVYTVKANRFLRGMVRALVSTMLKVARGKISIQEFDSIFSENNNSYVDFSAPAHGLFLVSVTYPGRTVA